MKRKLPPKKKTVRRAIAQPTLVTAGLKDLAAPAPVSGSMYHAPAAPRVATTGPDVAAQTMLMPLHHDHPLRPIFDDALAQVARGKGQARHGRGPDFMKQHWRELAREHGAGFLTGQSEKKLRESKVLPHAQRREELLGAMVYAAIAILHFDLESQGK